MKIIKTVFFTICFTLLNVFAVFADEEPPVFPTDPVEPPLPVPIDNHIVFLVIAGLLLGITLIYKNKIKKASM